jgi:hypothetical protein
VALPATRKLVIDPATVPAGYSVRSIDFAVVASSSGDDYSVNIGYSVLLAKMAIDLFHLL